MKKILLLGAVLFSQLAIATESYFFFSPEMAATHLKDYTPTEKEWIQKDLNVVRSVCFKKPSEQNHKPIYLATAGGPGARKTTILERFLSEHPEMGDGVYLDPDQRGLKFMPHTYYSQSLCAREVGEREKYAETTKLAYEKWRGASNYITVTLLEEAFAEKRDVIHGTTCTGGHVPAFLNKLKQTGYEIVLLLCSADDAFRKNAVRYRNEEQKFYQSTPEDAVSKGKAFPERMNAFFAYADTLYLFWSDDLNTKETLAAVFKDHKLDVRDKEAYDKFVAKYEADRASLAKEGKGIPAWRELLALRQK